MVWWTKDPYYSCGTTNKMLSSIYVNNKVLSSVYIIINSLHWLSCIQENTVYIHQAAMCYSSVEHNAYLNVSFTSYLPLQHVYTGTLM